MDSSVHVVVRIRPLNESEKQVSVFPHAFKEGSRRGKEGAANLLPPHFSFP